MASGWTGASSASRPARQQLGDTIRIGRRGSLSGILTVHGLAGHVAYPHLARNPIQAFAPVLTALYGTPLDNGNEFFPPSSFQVVKLESIGDAVNVTPGSLSARFNIRYSTVWTHERLRGHIEALFPRAQARLHARLAPVGRAVPDAAGRA